MPDKNKLQLVLEKGKEMGWDEEDLRLLTTGYYDDAVDDLYELISKGENVSPALAEYCIIHADD